MANLARRNVVIVVTATVLGAGGALVAPDAAATPRPVCQSDTCTVTFTSGVDTFVVPDKISRVEILAIGAGGRPLDSGGVVDSHDPGGVVDSDGLGAKVTSTIGVEVGQILEITVASADGRSARALTNSSGVHRSAGNSGATTVSRGSEELVVAAGAAGRESSLGDSITTTTDAPVVVISYFDPDTIPDTPTCSGWGCLFDS